MPKLGDFIGTLLSDAAYARMRADLEIIKIAQAYNGHELLKHLPVPRFRLPEIHVDVPVLLSELKGAQFISPAPQAVEVVLNESLAQAGVILPDDQQKADLMQISVTDVLKRVKSIVNPGDNATETLPSVAKEAAVSCGNILLKKHSSIRDNPDIEDKLEKFKLVAAELFKKLFFKGLQLAPSLEIKIAAGDLKDINHSDAITHIQFTLSEDSYEMLREDSDDSKFRLVPE